MKSKPEAQESVKTNLKIKWPLLPVLENRFPFRSLKLSITAIQGNLEIPLLLPATLHFFSSALQDAGALRASVGSPLDGQKVKLRPSPLSGLPLYLPSVLPFVSVCLSSRLCGNYTYGGW